MDATLRRSACMGARAFLVTAACAGLTSCGAANDPGRGVPDAGARSFARLAVVLTASREGGITVGAIGRLLRFRGVDLDSAQVLAGARDRDRAPLNRCQILDEEAQLEDALASSPPEAAVQMLDAGDVLVRAGGQTVTMAPRYLPDIVPFVSGVVYDAQVTAEAAADFAGRDERDEARITAFGGQQVAGFDIAADLPAMPRFLTLAGAPASDGIASVDPASSLAVTWTGDPKGRGAVTLVVTHDTGPVLRCRVSDSGRFEIPAAELGRILGGARGEPAMLAVERTHHSSFWARGLDAGEIEVTTRDVITLR